MPEEGVSPYTGRPIVEWLDEDVELHDADGDEIGDVVEINPDFLVVEAGSGVLGLGESRVYFVPRSYVAREEGDDWYLSIDKDELESMNWRQAPTESAWSGEWAEGQQAPAEEGRGRTRLRRYEEDLAVQKTEREAGDVTVTKRVVEDVKSIDVPIRREEVHIERRAVSGDATSTHEAFIDDGQTIRVPVMEEDVEVRKVIRPVEEIEITKTATEETEQVQDTVRREEIDVDDQTKRGDRQ